MVCAAVAAGILVWSESFWLLGVSVMVAVLVLVVGLLGVVNASRHTLMCSCCIIQQSRALFCCCCCFIVPLLLLASCFVVAGLSMRDAIVAVTIATATASPATIPGCLAIFTLYLVTDRQSDRA